MGSSKVIWTFDDGKKRIAAPTWEMLALSFGQKVMHRLGFTGDFVSSTI
jgi:hypothetical protein